VHEGVLERSPTRGAVLLRRSYRLPLEMAVVAAVLVLWQLIRIPLEGSTDVALAHARDWLEAERSLHVDVEQSLVDFATGHGHAWHRFLELAYGNVHIPVIFGFMASARLLAPLAYPSVRTAFVAAHVPALVLIGAYPLAPPKWLTDGPPAHDAALRNETAAVVSMHFGYPVFVAGTALWLAWRRPWTWLTLLYPPFVFLVIVGTGNHYVLDALLGSACVAFGVVAARLLHGPLRARGRPAPTRTVAGAAALWGMAGLVVNALLTGEWT
jgi:hypothetical protein